MVALHGREMIAMEIDAAVVSLNRVDPGGNLVRTAEEFGIMLGR